MNNYFKTFEQYTHSNITVLYHGCDSETLDDINGYMFFSESSSFSSSYGDYLHEVQVELSNIFDSTSLEHIELIYNAGYHLSDPYFECMDDEEIEEMEVDGYNIEEGYYETASAFYNSPYSSDTWEAIESTDGVIDWILSNGFDNIHITEGGYSNYYTHSDNIVSYRLIK
jgi:hypothetical protein